MTIYLIAEYWYEGAKPDLYFCWFDSREEAEQECARLSKDWSGGYRAEVIEFYTEDLSK